MDNTVEAYYETFHLNVSSCHGDFVPICEAPLNGLTLTLHFLCASMVFQTHGHNLTQQINISAYSLTSPFKHIKLVPLIVTRQRPRTCALVKIFVYFILCLSWADFQVLQNLEPSCMNHPLPQLHFSLCPFLPPPPPSLFPVCGGPSRGEVHREGKAHCEFKCTGLKTQLASTKGEYDNGRINSVKEMQDNDLLTWWFLRQ